MENNEKIFAFVAIGGRGTKTAVEITKRINQSGETPENFIESSLKLKTNEEEIELVLFSKNEKVKTEFIEQLSQTLNKSNEIELLATNNSSGIIQLVGENFLGKVERYPEKNLEDLLNGLEEIKIVEFNELEEVLEPKTKFVLVTERKEWLNKRKLQRQKFLYSKTTHRKIKRIRFRNK